MNPSKPSQDAIPLKEKIAYGAGQVGGTSDFIINSLVNPIFVLQCGMSPSVVSLLTIVYRIFDAFTDTLMGWISDNTRTRWGRRRPYLLIGAILSGLWLPVMWFFSPQWNLWVITAWMAGCWLVLYLFQTIWNIPYQSLLLEMSPDPRERVSISALRSYFGLAISVIFGWLWTLCQLPVFNKPNGEPDLLNGARWICAGVGLLIIGFGVLPALFTRERYYEAASGQHKISLKDNFRLTLQNRPFLILAVFTLLFTLGTYLKMGVSFWVRLYYVCGGDQVLAARLGGIEGTLFVVSGVVGIRYFQWLAARTSNLTSLKVVMWCVFVGSISTIVTYTPAMPYLSILSILPIGLATSGLWMLLPAINADIADYDEMETRERREGAFASIYSWLLKLAIGLATGLSGPIVDLTGFRASYGVHQPETALFWGRLLLALLPAITIGGAIYALSRFPLTGARMSEIRSLLTARHRTSP